MALVEVKVPQLAESVAQATMMSWKKKVGEIVAQDETLIEIETDKVVLEVPAPQAGVIAEIRKQESEDVSSNEVIAVIDTDAQASAQQPKSETRASSEKPVVSAPTAPASTAKSDTQSDKLMPAAAKLLADNKLAAAQVTGTGKDGRITKGDVLKALEVPAAQASLPKATTPSASDSANRPEQRVPMSRLRARVAERLLQSQATNAILTTFNEVDMQAVMDLRHKYKDQFEKEHGIKLGFMSFFIKATIQALKKYPIVNASVDGSDIIYHGYFDIGIAVGSPRGLVVPILRDADQMTIAELEKKIVEFGQKAKDGKLSIEELSGGTFSISNGGVFGSMLSTPIINPPQSAILGIHATKERPVVEKGQIVIRPINYLALSYDHRIIDGREAVLSLVAIKQALEDPARLLLDL